MATTPVPFTCDTFHSHLFTLTYARHNQYTYNCLNYYLSLLVVRYFSVLGYSIESDVQKVIEYQNAGGKHDFKQKFN